MSSSMKPRTTARCGAFTLAPLWLVALLTLGALVGRLPFMGDHNADIDDLVSRMEDPRKLVRQMIREMEEAVSQWNVSPKLENSGNDQDRREVPEALQAFRDLDSAYFKFVVVDPSDIDEVLSLSKKHDLPAEQECGRLCRKHAR